MTKLYLEKQIQLCNFLPKPLYYFKVWEGDIVHILYIM